MKYEISAELLQKILNFLITKPFSEVAQLIQEMQTNIKEIKEVPSDKS